MPLKLNMLLQFSMAFTSVSPGYFHKHKLLNPTKILSESFIESVTENHPTAFEPPLTFSHKLKLHQKMQLAQNKKVQKIFGFHRPIRVKKIPPRFQQKEWITNFRPTTY